MIDPALYLAAAVFALCALCCVLARGGGRTAAVRYGGYGVACLGATLVALDPATLAAADRLRPYQLLPVLLGDTLRLCSACSVRLFALALWTVRPNRTAVRRQLALAAVVFLIQVGLAIGSGMSAVDGRLVVPGNTRWCLAGYDAMEFGYLGYCLLALTGRLAPQALRAPCGQLRTGLRLITLGVVAGLLWTAWGIDDVLSVARTGMQDGGEDGISALLGVVCGALVATGVGVTFWAPVRDSMRRWCSAYRRYRALTPLWAELHTVLPEIALEPSRTIPPRDVQFALYRRIIEIHDARLILRHYLDPRTPAWLADAVRRFPPPANLAAATAEAATLAAALARAATGGLPAPGPTPGPDLDAPERPLDAEADWLAQLATAFANSRAVAEVRKRAHV